MAGLYLNYRDQLKVTSNPAIQRRYDIPITSPSPRGRDVILDLAAAGEIRETKYISSFRITTPDLRLQISILHPTSYHEGIAYISPPENARWVLCQTPVASVSCPIPSLFLSSQTDRIRKRRGRDPADASSSLAPTSCVAPSTYYQPGIRGINGGRLANDDARTSFTDSVQHRGHTLPRGRLSTAFLLKVYSVRPRVTSLMQCQNPRNPLQRRTPYPGSNSTRPKTMLLVANGRQDRPCNPVSSWKYPTHLPKS
ncbi:hypothetical protein BC826DRAFT_591073 [Russula brevipes]|nr:hypothetical protein BC826DRAFT_591073 [Russula brevipes]